MSDDNVSVRFPAVNGMEEGDVIAPAVRADQLTPVKDVLEAAIERELDSVVVIGKAEDGSLYLASSARYLSDVIYALKRAEYEVMGPRFYTD